MKLTRLQSARLFKLFDPLTIYANERLDVVDANELLTADARGISDVAQAHVASELWQNLDVIDSYTSENPDALSAGELDLVRQWREALSGYFIVTRFPDGVVRFMRDKFAFEVCGISSEIADMVGELPVTVSTTLLPFDGRIVFAEYLNVLQVSIGPNMLASLEEEMDSVLESGMIVSSAKGLLVAASIIRENEIQRETERLMSDLENENRLAEPVQGQHRGVLAGLDEEERERSIHEQSDRDWHDTGYSPFTWLEEQCLQGPVSTNLADLVRTRERDYVEGLAGYLRDAMVSEHAVELHDRTVAAYIEAVNAKSEDGVEQDGPDRLAASPDANSEATNDTPDATEATDEPIVTGAPNSADAADVLGAANASHPSDAPFDTQAAIRENEAAVEKYREELDSRDAETIIADYYTKTGHLQRIIALRGAPRIEALRELCERGGRLSVRKDSLKTPAKLPFPIFGLCWAFFDGETFEFVIPDEVMDAVRNVDWDAALDYDDKRRELILFFDALTELRGIATFDEALADYLDFYPNAFPENEAYDTLLDAIGREECGAHVLDTPDGEEYLLHYELAWEWRRSRRLDVYGGDRFEEGPLGAMLENLLAQQEGKEPRPIEPDMLADEFGLFSWKLKQPACRKMRSFFDEHVPDERSDYYFADKVMEDLIEEAKWGLDNNSVNTLFRILEDNDFTPEEHQVQPLLTMWMNIGNSLPVWPNNGWAPNEMLERDLGRPVFFNEDGSIKRVGRNDPCPCGSGKKYKKCCGR